VLFPKEFRASRSLQKAQRNRGYRTTIDQDFRAVIEGCAAPRAASTGTWITADMQRAYADLHARGFAHSIETYLGAELIGGLYGVRMGGVFFGESMFSRERDASKIALAQLVQACMENDIVVIDCQLPSRHLRSLGSRAISRAQFHTLVCAHAAAEALPIRVKS
jgi:leucyl/phenylalanyl-tRNA---protein transferase